MTFGSLFLFYFILFVFVCARDDCILLMGHHESVKNRVYQKRKKETTTILCKFRSATRSIRIGCNYFAMIVPCFSPCICPPCSMDKWVFVHTNRNSMPILWYGIVPHVPEEVEKICERRMYVGLNEFVLSPREISRVPTESMPWIRRTYACYVLPPPLYVPPGPWLSVGTTPPHVSRARVCMQGINFHYVSIVYTNLKPAKPCLLAHQKH